MFTCFAIGASVLSLFATLSFLISTLCLLSEDIRSSGPNKWTQTYAAASFLISTVALSLTSGGAVWLWQRACA